MEASRQTVRQTAVPTSDPQETPGKVETAYVILQQGDAGGYWPVETPGSDDGDVRAGSADAAIKLYLEAVDDDEGDPTGQTYVAVPRRSWRPRVIGGVEAVPAKRQFKLG